MSTCNPRPVMHPRGSRPWPRPPLPQGQPVPSPLPPPTPPGVQGAWLSSNVTPHAWNPSPTGPPPALTRPPSLPSLPQPFAAAIQLTIQNIPSSTLPQPPPLPPSLASTTTHPLSSSVNPSPKLKGKRKRKKQFPHGSSMTPSRLYAIKCRMQTLHELLEQLIEVMQSCEGQEKVGEGTAAGSTGALLEGSEVFGMAKLEADRCKDELSALQAELTPASLSIVAMKIKKAEKHKEWKRKRIQEMQTYRDTTEERRAKLHKEIDAQRANVLARDQEIREQKLAREKERKERQAQERIHLQQKQTLLLIQNLQRLRTLRLERAMTDSSSSSGTRSGTVQEDPFFERIRMEEESLARMQDQRTKELQMRKAAAAEKNKDKKAKLLELKLIEETAKAQQQKKQQHEGDEEDRRIDGEEKEVMEVEEKKVVMKGQASIEVEEKIRPRKEREKERKRLKKQRRFARALAAAADTKVEAEAKVEETDMSLKKRTSTEIDPTEAQNRLKVRKLLDSEAPPSATTTASTSFLSSPWVPVQSPVDDSEHVKRIRSLWEQYRVPPGTEGATKMLEITDGAPPLPSSYLWAACLVHPPSS